MKLSLPADYPSSAPKGFFTTKIWHPNVSKAGEICVNVLKRDWKADLGIRHVLMVIRCLLIEPYPESALNEEAGKALLEDYQEYARYAKLMTDVHAPHPKRHIPLTASGANAAGSPSKDGSMTAAAAADGSPAIKKAKPEQKAAAVVSIMKQLFSAR
jgi:ubiquitin-conjugating enzyme E2 S